MTMELRVHVARRIVSEDAGEHLLTPYYVLRLCNHEVFHA